MKYTEMIKGLQELNESLPSGLGLEALIQAQDVLPYLYEALKAIINHFQKLDKLYLKDLEMLGKGDSAIAKAEGRE